ncbi:MAG: hypothetical protein AB7S26_11565 [Sandaracinaceae bacterium]
MRRALPLASILASSISLGCSPAGPPPPRSSLDVSALDAWDARAPMRDRRALAHDAAPPLQERHDSASARDAVPGALGDRGRRIDVRFHRAPLASALRLLAEQGEVDIVIGEGLDREISLDLRRVRPLDAMWALAEAHDVELSRVGRTVIARSR